MARSLENKTFACNSNTAPSHILVVSVVVPDGIQDWTGFGWTIRFESDSPTLPPWWQLRGQCRNGLTGVYPPGAGVTGCVDPYDESFSGGFYPLTLNDGAPNRARLTGFLLEQVDTYRPLAGGTEYIVSRMAINNQKTVGPTSCAGCFVGVCIEASEVEVQQSDPNSGGSNTTR